MAHQPRRRARARWRISKCLRQTSAPGPRRTVYELRVCWGVFGTSSRGLGASWERYGASWGRLGSLLGRLGGVLGPSWGVLRASWVRIGASWVRLGPSAARLGASWRHLVLDFLGRRWLHLGMPS